MKNYLVILILIVGCGQPTKQVEKETAAETPVKKQRPIALDNGKFFEAEGKKMLYGGDSTQHFDITDYTLNDGQFHYGIGREVFQHYWNLNS